MPKKITQTEITNVLKWLNGEITTADLARKIKLDPRHMQVYVRTALVVRKLYQEKSILLIKQQ